MWVLWNKIYFIKTVFENFTQLGLKELISNDADFGPLMYVLWCCGSICHQLFNFIQIYSVYTVIVLGHNFNILAIVDSICQQRKACMRKTGRMQIESRVRVEIRLEGWLDIGWIKSSSMPFTLCILYTPAQHWFPKLILTVTQPGWL